MLNLIFVPESEKFTEATKAYSNIWFNMGEKIIYAIENAAGLGFKDEQIEAVVFEGISQSHPLKLRASYDDETKAATVVHELLHRLSSDHMMQLPDPGDSVSLGLHKQINLVLYDIWNELFGIDVAKRQVYIESKRTPIYDEAWRWALGFTKEQRLLKFAELRQH